MNTKFTLQLLVAAVVWGLAACGGDPTNRQSDPLKTYNGIKSDIPESERDKTTFPKQGPVEKDGDVLACGRFGINISNVEPDGSLHYLVQQEKTVRVHVDADYSSVKLRLVNAPDGMSVKKVGATDWDLQFKPAMSEGNLSQPVTFVFNVPEDRCVRKGTFIEKHRIVVNINSTQPDITVVGLDPVRVYQPGDKIPFDVTVSDPTLRSNEQPPAPEFDFSAKRNPTEETPYLNGNGAASCGGADPAGALQKFVFHCAIDVTKVVAQNQEAKLGITAFDVFVKSAHGEEVSVHQDQQVLINLPPAPDAQQEKVNAPPPPPESKAPTAKEKKPKSKKAKQKAKSKKATQTKPSQQLTQFNFENESGVLV